MKIVHPGNNGNLNHLFDKKFVFRILAENNKVYDEVLKYLEGIAIQSSPYGDNPGGKRYYVFDEKKKQIALANRPRRTIELTRESVKIKKGIEELIYQN